MHPYDKLVSNAVLREAVTSSLAQTSAVSEQRYARSTYVLTVLQASLPIRNFIAARCAESIHPGQHDLAVNIALYNSLSSAKKALFLDEYARRFVVASAGGRYVAVQNAYPYPHTLHPHQVP